MLYRVFPWVFCFCIVPKYKMLVVWLFDAYCCLCIKMRLCPEVFNASQIVVKKKLFLVLESFEIFFFTWMNNFLSLIVNPVVYLHAFIVACKFLIFAFFVWHVEENCSSIRFDIDGMVCLSFFVSSSSSSYLFFYFFWCCIKIWCFLCLWFVCGLFSFAFLCPAWWIQVLF